MVTDFFAHEDKVTNYDDDNINDLYLILREYTRFEKVYRREIFIPIMFGCPVEDYDDSRFYDKEYIKSIADANNLIFVDSI